MGRIGALAQAAELLTVEIQTVTFDSPLGRKAAALRVAVFVEEQNVPAELELDEYDPTAVHLVGIENGAVIATLRIIAKQTEAGKVLKIGRVAVAKPHRNRGLGKQLMQAAIDHARQQKVPACILTAQLPVIAFYEKLGFIAHGPVFDECGIDHRAMRLDLP
jgi:ElaA protein